MTRIRPKSNFENAPKSQHPMAAISNERGFFEIFASVIALICVMLGMFSLQSLIRYQTQQTAAARKIGDLTTTAEQIANTLADPGNCERNLGTIKFGTDIKERGISVFDESGVSVSNLIDMSRNPGVIIKSIKLTNAKPFIADASGKMKLVDLEIRAQVSLTGVEVVRAVPIFVDTDDGTTVKTCNATYRTEDGLTVEEKTCASLPDLGLEDEFKSTELCLQWAVQRTRLGSSFTLADGGTAIKITHELPVGWIPPIIGDQNSGGGDPTDDGTSWGTF